MGEVRIRGRPGDSHMDSSYEMAGSPAVFLDLSMEMLWPRVQGCSEASHLLRDRVTMPEIPCGGGGMDSSRGKTLVRSGQEEGLIPKDCGVAYGASGPIGAMSEIQE